MILGALFLAAALHTPEQCVTGKRPVTLEHGGRTYRFAFEDCRDEFLKDPERYSQLYDALAELEAAGEKIESRPPSLVPS